MSLGYLRGISGTVSIDSDDIIEGDTGDVYSETAYREPGLPGITGTLTGRATVIQGRYFGWVRVNVVGASPGVGWVRADSLSNVKRETRDSSSFPWLPVGIGAAVLAVLVLK